MTPKKIAIVLGPYSTSTRPLDFYQHNIWQSSRGLTGTDLTFVQTAIEFKRLGYDVSAFTVHSQPQLKPVEWEGIKLFSIDDLPSIDNTFDAILSINEPDIFRFTSKKPVKILWQMLNDFPYCGAGWENLVDVALGVCPQHTEHLKKQVQQPQKWSSVPLGCSPEWYQDQRVPGRMIWCSSADRGLHWLLEEWMHIKRAVPYATLKIFYHFQFNNIESVEIDSPNPEYIKEMGNRIRYIKQAIEKLKPYGVEHIGSISRDQMRQEFNEASVFPFCCDTVTFSEGFSVSAMEAHASYTVPIISEQDCLGGIYIDSGCVMLKTPIADNLLQFREAVIKSLTDQDFANQTIQKCRNFAQQYTWANSAKQINVLITNHYKKATAITSRIELPTKKKMKIGIVASNSWPVPWSSHTGDYFYALLAQTLDEMGHDVSFFAPEGSYAPPHGQFFKIDCSWGKPTPAASEYETATYAKYADILKAQDVVHDFSIAKGISEALFREGYKNAIPQTLPGKWDYACPPRNIIVASEAMKQRMLRGATDYENTPTPDAVGKYTAIKDAHVVNHAIDTDFYYPTYQKENYFLWLGRWNPVRGFKLAIELAKQTGIELIMAGEHPDREVCQYQKGWSAEAIELAKDCPNIKFVWLPADPEHHEVKRSLLQKAKAFLFPVQFNEPFGLMQAESLACGTPMIGTNYGSVPEVIRHGITGFVVNNNWQDFAKVLPLIDTISPAICREDAVKRFDRRVMVENYLREYRLVIEGKSW